MDNFRFLQNLSKSHALAHKLASKRNRRLSKMAPALTPRTLAPSNLDGFWKFLHQELAMVLSYPVVPHLLSCDLCGRSYGRFGAIGFWRGGAEGGSLDLPTSRAEGRRETLEF